MRTLRWMALTIAACSPATTSLPPPAPPAPGADGSFAQTPAGSRAPDSPLATSPQEAEVGAPSTTGPGGTNLTDQANATRGIVLKRGNQAAPPPDWSQVSLSVTVEASVRDRGECLVMSGARLHSGDRFALLVGVARPAYVYIVQASPDGTASILYPASGTPAYHLTPQRLYRVPEDVNDHFELDQDIGREHLAVIASEQPLDDAAPQLARLVNQVRASGRPPSRRAQTVAPPPTPIASPIPVRLPPDANAGIASANGLTRGIVLSSGSSGRALDVKADADHVATAWLEFDHVP